MFDRTLHMVEVIVSRQQRGATPEVWFYDFVRTEHIQKLFAREFSNKETLASTRGDQALMFQDRQCFPHRGTTDSQRLSQPLLDEWFIALKLRVKDCLLDRLVRCLPKPARRSDGNQFESLVHIFHLSRYRTESNCEKSVSKTR